VTRAFEAADAAALGPRGGRGFGHKELWRREEVRTWMTWGRRRASGTQAHRPQAVLWATAKNEREPKQSAMGRRPGNLIEIRKKL